MGIPAADEMATDPLPKDFKGCKELLRKLRHDGNRSSQVVLACVDVLQTHRGRLGDEVWNMLEQDTMAALDMHLYARAEKNIAELKARFGNESLRISILDGLLLEARQEYDKATQIYEDIVKENEGHQGAMKRLIAISKDKGVVDKTVKLLKEYLEVHQTDQDAWLELASIYIAACEYKFAAFCYEDLILIQPYNWMYHVKYAELLYTMGGSESIEYAKKAFMQAYELKPKNNPRALYGVCLCVSTLGAGNYSRRASADIKEDLMQEFCWAMDELREVYKDGAMWKYVEVSLNELKAAIKM